MTRRLNTSLVLILALALCGCSSPTSGSRISLETIAFVHPGTTRRAEVVEELGPPLLEIHDPHVLAYSWAAGRPIAAQAGPEQVIAQPGPTPSSPDTFIDITPWKQVGSVEKRRWIWCLVLNADDIVVRSGKTEVNRDVSLETAVRAWASQ